MRNRLVLFVILGVSLVFGLLFARQMYLSKDLPRAEFRQKTLRVLTYSTFAGAVGPGGPLVAAFKKHCNCDVKMETAGDAGLLLERLRLAEESYPYDVVIGLDQNLLTAAREKAQWREIQVDRNGWAPEIAALPTDKQFIPFDWSPMTFVYRVGGTPPPKSFAEIREPRFQNKFALQEPHASSPGLQFLSWVTGLQGDGTEDFLRSFKANVTSVSPSWAFSYGLFKKQQAEFVFSYLTSLAFHWGLEKDRAYQVVSFPEGHPVQVEYAAVPASCRECELAERFVQELLQPDAQKTIMEKNFMFPVLSGLTQNTVYAELPRLKVRAAAAPTGNDLNVWDKVFKR